MFSTRRKAVIASILLLVGGLAVGRAVLALQGPAPESSSHATRAKLARQPPGAAHRHAAPVVISVDRSKPVGRSRLALGVTHTQHSVDAYGDRASVSRAKRLLRKAAVYQNQHIYGFGAVNPEPAPGRYDWRTLDARVRLMRSTGADKVITLCCAPDWMTALRSRTSRYPNLPPTPAHVRDFAALAARVARRYRDVRHFIVWNEMKGFYDHASRNWDYRRYTRLYNAVYDALKAVNPAIKVGGPYLNIQGTGSRSLGKVGTQTADPITASDWAVLEYWLEHKHGADFVVIDRNVTPRHDPNRYSHSDQLQLARWFGDIVTELRRRTSLPIWYAENHMDPARNWAFQAVGNAAMLLAEVRAGTAVSLHWQPQGSAHGPFRGNDENLFSDTRVAGGGRPFPNFRVFRLIHRVFPRGTPLYRVTSSSPFVEALASPKTTVLLNLRKRKIRARIGARRLALGPYAIRAIPDFPHP
jgi:hypothetical protein